MRKTKDLTVFIGRFSPFHNGHADVLQRALQTSKVVLVLIGSSGQSRSTKNPFTFQERNSMIEGFYSTLCGPLNGLVPRDSTYGALVVKPLYDHPYNDQMWIEQVQAAVASVKRDFSSDLGPSPSHYLVGSDRDSSTWYLHAFGNFFKQDFIDAKHLNVEMSATEVRRRLFSQVKVDEIASAVPATTMKFLEEFMKARIFKELIKEYEYIEDYKSRWYLDDRDGLLVKLLKAISGIPFLSDREFVQNAIHKLIRLAPYPPTFVTVDAVVIQSGHVLVNVRDNFPGVGLWALPGGFLEQNEKLIDGCVRELNEETRIELSKAQLYGSIKDHEVFDHPGRSLRGRTITTAYLFKLDDSKPLPKVKPQKGEVKRCEWIPIHEALSRTDMWFEDHLSILQTMYGRISK